MGCVLLKLISSLDVFSRRNHSHCIKYLLTDYMPAEVEIPWENIHGKLKNLQKIMLEALEWISEDLSYFQTDLKTDKEKTSDTVERTTKHPMHWLVNKSSTYGKFFSGVSQSKDQNPWKLTPVMKRMMIIIMVGETSHPFSPS